MHSKIHSVHSVDSLLEEATCYEVVAAQMHVEEVQQQADIGPSSSERHELARLQASQCARRAGNAESMLMHML